MFRFIIEYQRVILFTSILITIIAGFGVNATISYFRKKGFLRENITLNYIQTGVLILFLLLSFRYTERNNWQRLKLVNIKDNTAFTPAAPANNYLHPDDLKLFKNIKKKKFLSIPWKGTVIGVATDNYPASVKHGTIGFKYKLYEKFMYSNCVKKYIIAKKHGIDYVYTTSFDCQNFEPIGKSRENLYLYKFVE